MAVLVLLAAAAGARVIAADLVAAVADRLGLLVALGAAGDRRVLLAANPIRARRPHVARRLLGRRTDRPQRLLEALLFLHAEDRVAHLVLHALPHRVELLHALPLVL